MRLSIARHAPSFFRPHAEYSRRGTVTNTELGRGGVGDVVPGIRRWPDSDVPTRYGARLRHLYTDRTTSQPASATGRGHRCALVVGLLKPKPPPRLPMKDQSSTNAITKREGHDTLPA